MRSLSALSLFAAGVAHARVIFNGTHHEEHDLVKGLDLAREFGGEGVYWAAKPAAGNSKRGVCQGVHTTYLHGDGNPHQNYVYTQKGDTFGCPGGGASYSFSVTVGWSLSLNINTPWISGGFSVSESKTEGISYSATCLAGNGLHATQSCLEHAMAVTAYTVDTCIEWDGDCPSGHDNHCYDTAIMYSPNANRGHQWFTSANVAGSALQGCSWSDDQIRYGAGPPGTDDWFLSHPPGIWNGAWIQASDPPNVAIPERVAVAVLFGVQV